MRRRLSDCLLRVLGAVECDGAGCCSESLRVLRTHSSKLPLNRFASPSSTIQSCDASDEIRRRSWETKSSVPP